jgi:hypothetical protein
MPKNKVQQAKNIKNEDCWAVQQAKNKSAVF